MSEPIDVITGGRAALGIELGSTRIKACLIGDDPAEVLAVGSHDWENEFVDRTWTYSLESVWSGIQAAHADGAHAEGARGAGVGAGHQCTRHAEALDRVRDPVARSTRPRVRAP